MSEVEGNASTDFLRRSFHETTFKGNGYTPEKFTWNLKVHAFTKETHLLPNLHELCSMLIFRGFRQQKMYLFLHVYHNLQLATYKFLVEENIKSGSKRRTSITSVRFASTLGHTAEDQATTWNVARSFSEAGVGARSFGQLSRNRFQRANQRWRYEVVFCIYEVINIKIIYTYILYVQMTF